MLEVEYTRFQVLDLVGEKRNNRFIVAGFAKRVEDLDHMVEFSGDLFFILLTLFILLVLLILLVSMKEFFDLGHEGRDDVGEQGVEQVGLFLVFLDHVDGSVLDELEGKVDGLLKVKEDVFEIDAEMLNVLDEDVLLLDIEVVFFLVLCN